MEKGRRLGKAWRLTRNRRRNTISLEANSLLWFLILFFIMIGVFAIATKLGILS